MNTKTLKVTEDGKGYRSKEGYTMQREEGVTPGGNQIGGWWVLRDPDGGWVDFDQFRYDLAGRNGFVVI